MNRVLGILIVLLYFGNHYISDYFEPIDNTKYYYLKVVIYSFMLCMGIHYKINENKIIGLLESVFVAIVISNSISLYFLSETGYSMNDLIIIPIIIILEIVKHFKKFLGVYSNFHR